MPEAITEQSSPNEFSRDALQTSVRGMVEGIALIVVNAEINRKRHAAKLSECALFLSAHLTHISSFISEEWYDWWMMETQDQYAKAHDMMASVLKAALG